MRDVTRQFTLFTEIAETQTTRDRVTDAGVFLRPPPGRGWRVLDAHRERHTKWQRRRAVVRPWKGKAKC
jgi:hypothetical protein